MTLRDIDILQARIQAHNRALVRFERYLSRLLKKVSA